MSRRITFPEPMSYGDPNNKELPPWGLADLIVERALSNPQLFSSVENCNRVIALVDKFKGLKSSAQTGKSVLVTDHEYEFLASAISLALAQLAKESGGALPLVHTSEIAVYMRAFHSAPPVTDEEAKP